MEFEIATYYTERSFLRVFLYEVEEIRVFAHLVVFTIIIFHTKYFLMVQFESVMKPFHTGVVAALICSILSWANH